MTVTQPTAYESEILSWRAKMEDSLRADDGWLTLAGLYMLQEGDNTIGSDPACDILLPTGSAHLGVIHFAEGQATLRVNAPILVDDVSVETAVLRDDKDPAGPSLVQLDAITFFVIKRGEQYAVRVRDRNSPARQTFAGRRWFAIDPAYCVTASFAPHAEPRTVQVMNSLGTLVAMTNPGYVDFELDSQRLRLEAFDASKDELWFIFKDATSGRQTYGAGRFLYAPHHADDTVTLDFNKAYSPPCAFTPHATCPLPPRENVLTAAIEAGEKG
jgi:uncharacterized protein (DUF1684 family)